MKRKLLLLGMLVCVSNFLNSQTIDVIGVGTLGATGLGNRTLVLTDIANITKVDVGATYKSGFGVVPNGTDVQFFDNDEGPFGTYRTQPDLIVKHFSNSLGESVGYFEATFNTFDNGGVNVSIVPINDVSSFYAFVHRNASDAAYKSYISAEVSFFYRNGSSDPYVYSIPINTASAQRNITIKIPISELDDGLVRKAVIDITAGDVTEHVEVNLFNLGNSFFLGEYVLENVPGNISEVTVSIYSPNDLIGEDSGDSFFVNGIVADVDIVEDQDPGCTLTQGYWKTHTKYDGDKKYDDTWAKIQPDGEDTPFFSSNKSYYEVLKRAPRGNPYYILAHQYIAAELNFLNGADPTDAQEAFDKAKVIFGKFTPRQVMNKIHRGRHGRRFKRKLIRLAKKLDDYNNGYTGPGHCDEDDEEEKECLTSDDVIVTPNPITSYGVIKFNATNSAKTKVYLFNSYGQPVCPLFYQWVDADQEVKIDINASYYGNGTYYIKIWNGDCIVVKRILIHCY